MASEVVAALVVLLVGVALGTLVAALGCSVWHSRRNTTPLEGEIVQEGLPLPDEEAEDQPHTDGEQPAGSERASVEQPICGDTYVKGVRMTEEQRASEEGAEIASGEQYVGGESKPVVQPYIGGERGQWLDTIAYSVRNPAFLMEDPNTPPDTPSTTHSLPTTPSRTHSPPSTPSRTCQSQS